MNRTLCIISVAKPFANDRIELNRILELEEGGIKTLLTVVFLRSGISIGSIGSRTNEKISVCVVCNKVLWTRENMVKGVVN